MRSLVKKIITNPHDSLPGMGSKSPPIKSQPRGVVPLATYSPGSGIGGGAKSLPIKSRLKGVVRLGIGGGANREHTVVIK